MPLPAPYDAWFEAIVGAPAPEEPLAPCDACPMCVSRGFSPSVKCCTYIPPMANFRAGAALRAGGEAARSVRARLKTARVTRLGLLPTRAEERLYDAERSRFGATDAVTCPFLAEDGGRCAVWAFRDVTCATWFCQRDRGEAGDALWEATADVLGMAEGLVAAAVACEDLEESARRAEALDWEDIRGLPGGEALAAGEARLQAAYAGWVDAGPG